MLSRKLLKILMIPMFLIFGGCATVKLDAGFSEISARVEERTAARIYWNNGTELDKEATDKVQALLKEKLNAARAVQIALINNRDLQALYSELGVAQADLVQAGLLNNPIFDAAVKFPTAGGGPPNLELSTAMNFLDLFYIPLRQRIAAARFEEVKVRIAGAVLDFTGRVRTALYLHQANEQMLELRRTIVQAIAASFEVARRLHEAGNLTDLDLARERVLTEASKLALRFAELGTRQSREALNTLMGLWGKDTEWTAEKRLPDIPAEAFRVDNIERVAVERSIDLENARQRIVVAGEQLGFNRTASLIPEQHLGPLGEREDGSWTLGPTLEFPVPLFDQGQARIARAVAELRRTQHEYYALAVRVRAMARSARDRLEGTRDRALYYRDILLPLHGLIVNEAQLHYNAMQLGPIQLLRAREQQIEAGVAYIEALRDYWLAHGDLAQIQSGRLPNSNGVRTGSPGSPLEAKVAEAH